MFYVCSFSIGCLRWWQNDKILNDVFITEKQFHTLVSNVMSLRTEFVNNLFKDNWTSEQDILIIQRCYNYICKVIQANCTLRMNLTLKLAKIITIFIIYPRNETFLVNSCFQRISHVAKHLPRWPPNHLLNDTIKLSSINFEI